MNKTRKKLRDGIANKMGLNSKDKLNSSTRIKSKMPGPPQTETRDYIEHFVAKPNGPEQEMEELAKAGIRNLFSRNNVKRVANLPARNSEKGTIVLSKPRSDTALENELRERERGMRGENRGLRTKKTVLQIQNDEYADEQGIYDEDRLWMRINQNAQYKNNEFASDPKVDTRIHSIEKLAGFKLPDFTTTRGIESGRGVPTSMRSYLQDSIDHGAFRKQDTVGPIIKRQDSALLNSSQASVDKNKTQITVERLKERSR